MTFGCNFESSMILEPWDKGGKARSFRYLWFFISERFFGLFMLLFGVIFTTFVVNCGQSGKNNFRIFWPFLGLSCGSVLSSFEGSPGVTRKGRGTGNAGQGEGLLGAEEPHYPCSGLPVAFTGRSLDPWKSSKPAYLRKALFLASLGLLRALWVLS